MKLGADELNSLTPPVELLVVVKVLKAFPLLRLVWVCAYVMCVSVCVCACFQLHVDRTCEGVKRHRVLSSRELPVSGSKVGASSVLRSGPVRASVEPKTCASGSKVGASSVLRSGPVPVSYVCRAKDLCIRF